MWNKLILYKLNKCQGQDKSSQFVSFRTEYSFPCLNEDFSGNEMSQDEENTHEGKKIHKQMQMKH